MHFSARNGENFAKRVSESTTEENTVFKKELYSMRKFNAFNLKRCFQPKIKQNTLFNEELYFMNEFDARHIF